MSPKKKPKARPRMVHFETTIPSIRSCSRCGVWLAAGVAEGLKVQVEFVPLDRGQQLWAILNGIELYAITRNGLVHLPAWRMSDPRFPARYPAHRCDVNWPKPMGAVHRPSRQDIPPY